MAETFRAFQVTDFAKPPALNDISARAPGSGEAEIAVRAAGLNFADLLMCDGRYQEKPPLPHTLGMELAGEITRLGPDCAGWQPGQRVMLFSGGGGFAERGIFPIARCVKLPDSVPFEAAAAMPVAYGSSYLALDHRAGLQPGETLLVTGAAGGVGLTAVELGAQMGARVIAAARGPEKCAIAEAAGAAHVIDTSQQDLRDAVRALGGADVVYETIGGDSFEAAFRATNPEGRILVIGFAGGDVSRIRANHLLVKNITVIGFYWGGYLRFAPDVLDASLARLLAWLAEGRIRPHISHKVPLSEAGRALDLLKNRQAAGKVLIIP